MVGSTEEARRVVESVIARIPEAAYLAPVLGFLAGAVLSVSPVSLPSVPVVVAAVAPGSVSEAGVRQRPRLLPFFPSVLAFVAGMDGVLGMIGVAVVQVAEVLTRAAVAMHVFSAVLLATLGLRLLLRRSSLCRQAGALSPVPSEAFVFGVVFGVTGCPACGPIALGVGAAAGLAGGPVMALGVVAAFVTGRAAVLLLAAGAGSRLLPSGTAVVPWRRLDVVVGVLFLIAAAYYAYRLGSGAVETRLPGEPGGPLP